MRSQTSSCERPTTRSWISSPPELVNRSETLTPRNLESKLVTSIVFRRRRVYPAVAGGRSGRGSPQHSVCRCMEASGPDRQRKHRTLIGSVYVPVTLVTYSPQPGLDRHIRGHFLCQPIMSIAAPWLKLKAQEGPFAILSLAFLRSVSGLRRDRTVAPKGDRTHSAQTADGRSTRLPLAMRVPRSQGSRPPRR